MSDRVSFRTPDDDAELGIDADDLRVAVGFEDLLPDFACEPQRLVATLDGAVRVEDRYGVNGTQVVDVTLKGLKTTLSRVTRQLEIDGDFEAPCLGGTVHVETTEPIGAPLGTGCFDAGRLQIGLPTGTAALRFGPGTALAVDRDGDGNFEDSYASCGELPRDTACEP